MNGIDYDVVGDYTLEDKLFSWESTIDVISWNALSGIDALNEECKDLHTGADGESKLWSEVACSPSWHYFLDYTQAFIFPILSEIRFQEM